MVEEGRPPDKHAGPCQRAVSEGTTTNLKERGGRKEENNFQSQTGNRTHSPQLTMQCSSPIATFTLHKYSFSCFMNTMKDIYSIAISKERVIELDYEGTETENYLSQNTIIL